MFKIGDFSRLSRVSIRTLRYYDRVGLLKPAYVDPFSDYRYYTADQLATLNLILALKDLGLSLDQIRDLLAESVPPEQLQGMLRLKRAELTAQIAEEQQRLARIEARLRHIEQRPAPDLAAINAIVLKSIPDQAAALLRTTIDAYPEVSRLFDQLFGTLAERHIIPAGPPMTLYHQPEYRDHEIDIEIAVPVADSTITLEGDTLVRSGIVPGVESAACLVHQGSYESVGSAYAALMRWLEINRYEIDGHIREVYLHDSVRDAMSVPIVEIQVPVKFRPKMKQH